MSIRKFVAVSLISGVMVGCGDSDSEKPAEVAVPEVKTVEVQKEAVEQIKVAEVKSVEEVKPAEEEVVDQKTAVEEEVKAVVADVKKKASDYTAMITKFTEMDLTDVKAQLVKYDAETLNGLGVKITETIKAETAKLTKLTESLKGLSFSDIGKAAELKEEITKLTDSKKVLTDLYDEVMAQIKTLTTK